MGKRSEQRAIDEAWERVTADAVAVATGRIRGMMAEKRLKMPGVIPTMITEVSVDVKMEAFQ